VKSRRLAYLAISLALVVGAWLVAGQPTIGRPSDATRVGLTELPRVDELRSQFNADAGMTRLILVLSPMCPECRAGARWVSDAVLAAYPTASLRVYAIWTDKYPGDGRAAWNGGGLTDPRVTHYWDGKDVTGRWFVANLPTYEGRDWDAFLLFGPHAQWRSQPGPLLASGSTVIQTKDVLARALAPLLGETRVTVPPTDVAYGWAEIVVEADRGRRSGRVSPRKSPKIVSASPSAWASATTPVSLTRAANAAPCDGEQAKTVKGQQVSQDGSGPLRRATTTASSGVVATIVPGVRSIWTEAPQTAQTASIRMDRSSIRAIPSASIAHMAKRGDPSMVTTWLVETSEKGYKHVGICSSFIAR
jgi:hypothetical protein